MSENTVMVNGVELESYELASGTAVMMKEWCEALGVDYGKARRAADKGELEGAEKVLNRWAIQADAPVPDFPESGGTGRAQRFPGTSRVHVYYEGEDVLEQLKNMEGVYLWDPGDKQPIGARSWEAFEGSLPEDDDNAGDEETKGAEEQEDLFIGF